MDISRRIKIRHLEAFVEVARQKSVGRAAITLSLTQPAVTRTIRELEEIVGAALVERDGRGIKLSHKGEVFLSHAGSGLAAVRGGISALANIATSSGPPVRIGALPTVSATVMPGAVADFLASGLKSPLRVVTGENRVLLDQLRKGDLDLVMGRMPAPEMMESLRFEPLYRDRVIFVVSRTHPLAGQRQVGADILSRYPVLVPPEGSIIHPYVERVMLEQGMARPVQAVETVSDSFGRAFVRSGDAIWIISRGVVAAEIVSGEFVELPIDTGSTLGAVGLISREADRQNDAAGFFADILRRRTMGS
ncbi:pca operon transcription factor PcaQ [Hoeflea phototrophica DFL-43]|uniref:Pca operon transcription factor PcaQ n=1 Tax=Hoeflea phototrophica (strain DSM 17068 / NCIMB 14078 / DFL-43) TaxID=411684 RepID=A9DHF0_HOEPD|nr:pca operon transcription factor PcaQ [Hoeflea phototrophica]EDQ31427.1 pca operon transcription factor PcaQ [Hoeflea phototrophica DFL-43]